MSDSLVRESACPVCGRATIEDVAVVAGTGILVWCRESHDARCGRPCRGARVSPRPAGLLATGEGPLDHCHERYRCGAPGCAGGAP